MDPTPLRDLLLGLAHHSTGGTEPLEVTGICTDTRKLKPGDLFVALRGEKSDGHEYVRQALDGGAVAAVVCRQYCTTNDIKLVVVEDTMRALGEMARNYRRKFHIPVVAITGSVGKTSVREMTAGVLRTCYKTLSSQKNFNNEIGVPLTLFELGMEHEVALIEMGMRGLGEIDRLAEIAEPTIALITNIGHSHIERLGSRDLIAQAKAELLERLPANGIAILPRHDPYFDYLMGRVPAGCSVIAYSDSPEHNPDVWIELSEDGLEAVIDGKKIELVLDPPAAHTARNAAAALSAGLALNIPGEVARNGLVGLKPVEGRLRTLSGSNSMTVIDDCYNAAPESMAAALDVLAKSAAMSSLKSSAGSDGKMTRRPAVRRVAVLGDMRELGDYARELHWAVGRQVIDTRVDVLVTVGELAAEIANEAQRYALDTGRPCPLHSHFTDSSDAVKGIESIVAPLDLVLVKGSRAMAMETIVAALTGDRGAGTHG